MFHGGWGRYGYIMDTRVASATCEHPIHPFSDDGPIDHDDLMPETPVDPAEIEPFGYWLERHVHELVSEISHRLPFINQLTGQNRTRSRARLVRPGRATVRRRVRPEPQ